MAHEVFVCYSSQDKAVADSVCAMLEGIGLRCWIAPRDVPAGKWGGAIMEAVAQSRLMVLIFSANSNNSANCLSEVHAAFSKRDTIIPMRIDNTIPSGDMEYYLQTYHWLDARTPPFEMHLQGLADRVKTDLAHAAAREEAAARVKKEAEEAKKAQEAARAKKEAEEAAKEKARQEAATARARQQAEATGKEKARREAEAARIKKEAEEASKEKARWEEEAVRARQEAGEAKKAREAALKAKREAEKAVKEKARQEAGASKARREAEKARKEEKPTVQKKIAKSGWFWLGFSLFVLALAFGWGNFLALVTSHSAFPIWINVVIPISGAGLGLLLIALSHMKPRNDWFWGGMGMLPWPLVAIPAAMVWVSNLGFSISAFSSFVVGVFLLVWGWPRVTEKKPAAVEIPAGTRKRISKLPWLLAGVVFSLAGIVVGWGFALIWSGFFGFPVEEEPWYRLFSYILLFGLPGVIPGVLFIRRGIAGYFLIKPADGKASYWWWFLPIALGFIGGIISWFANKNVNWRQARNMLTAGVLLSLMFTIIPLVPGKNIVDIFSFKDDFEDGNAYGWNLRPGWRVVNDNGNYVLEGKAQDYQWAWPRVTQATNWVLEADFKLITGSLRFNTLYSQGAASPNRYLVEITEGGLSLAKEYSENNARNFIPLDKSQADIVLNNWYHIAISVGGNFIRVYLNDELKINGWDNNPLNSGNFAIEIGKNSHAYVDNIAVKPYLDRRLATTPAPTPTPTTAPAPTPTQKPTTTPISTTSVNDVYIFGYVLESGTNTPIYLASVQTFTPGTTSYGPIIQTDKNGYYISSPIAAGSYSIRVMATGYVTKYYNNVTDVNKAGSVSINAGQGGIMRVDFTLERAGSISGKVTDAQGNALNNVNIVAFDYTSNQAKAGVNTNTDGTYQLAGLQAGTYKVRASPSSSKLPYADEYYKDTSNIWGALPVTVKQGQDTTGIDFSLDPAGTISGKVSSFDGSTPLAGVVVECILVVNGAQTAWISVSTDSQGNYTVSGLPYGEYIVRARGHNSDFVQEYYPEKTRSINAQLIKVASGINPVNINFTLEAGGSISGKVVSDADSKSIAYVHIDVTDYNTGEWLSCADTNSDGTYTVHGLPAGSYRVKVSPTLNKLPYAEEYYDNTTNSITAKKVEVIVGKDTPNINFSLAPK